MLQVLSIEIAQIIKRELNAVRKNFLVATDYPVRMHCLDRMGSTDFSRESR